MFWAWVLHLTFTAVEILGLWFLAMLVIGGILDRRKS